VDGTGSGSCPMAGFGISGVKTSGGTTKIPKANLAKFYTVGLTAILSCLLYGSER
jgi:uncharacterized membrane protein